MVLPLRWMLADLIKGRDWFISKGKREQVEGSRWNAIESRVTREEKGSRCAGIRNAHSSLWSLFYTTRAFNRETTCTYTAPKEPSWNTASALGLQTMLRSWAEATSSKSHGTSGLWPSKSPARWMSGHGFCGDWAGKPVRISAYEAGPCPKVPLTGSHSRFPDHMLREWANKEPSLLSAGECRLYTTTDKAPKAVEVAGSIEGGDWHSGGSKLGGLVMLCRNWQEKNCHETGGFFQKAK